MVGIIIYLHNYILIISENDLKHKYVNLKDNIFCNILKNNFITKLHLSMPSFKPYKLILPYIIHPILGIKNKIILYNPIANSLIHYNNNESKGLLYNALKKLTNTAIVFNPLILERFKGNKIFNIYEHMIKEYKIENEVYIKIIKLALSNK